MSRILVVEDDLLVGQDISLKLQQLGYIVVAVVSSSEAAVQAVTDTQPDLILMDIILEGEIDGIDTAARINKSRTTPIIYLTAYDDDDFIKRAAITEPYGYVLKPYTARELHAAVSISLYKVHTEQALRYAAQICATLASMSDPVLKVDRSGRVQMCNRAAEQMLLASEKEILNQPIDSVVRLQWTDREGTVLRDLIDSVYSSGQALQIEQDLVIRSDLQQPKPVSLRISEVPDTADVEGGAVLLLQDISEHTALQEELKLVAQVFKSSSESIVITDLQAQILRVNDAYLNITGYCRDEVIGRNSSVLSSNYHDEKFYRQMWQSLLETGSWLGEIWNRRKNGEVYPELMNITVVRDDKGNPTNYVGIATDLSISKFMQEQLNFLTLFDSLTGLANRNLFQDRVDLAIDRARVSNHSLTLLMVDIDNFNTINDISGHAFGDELLIEFAKRITKLLQSEEGAARFGGDLFALSVEESEGGVSITELAQALLDSLSAPFYDKGKPIQLTVSIGISVYPADGGNVFELLKSVDNALHNAKRAGKNNYRFFDKAMYDTVLEVRSIEQGLRTAIERNELQLHYQPQIDVSSGMVRGCEALVRWYPQGKGEIYPVQFIPIAEETGQIIAIGKWILHEACEQFGRWSSAGCAPHHIAVNVSARQFRDPEFVSVVRDIIEKTGMRPGTLMLEITESVAMEQGEASVNKFTDLKKLGIKLALDDFGTGYSALSSLQRYPFDTLKIDRSFIVQSQSSSQGALMLEAIIRMSEGLELETIAEGVEDVEQLNFLCALGCSLVQGYFYSRPVPESKIGAMVLSGFDSFVVIK